MKYVSSSHDPSVQTMCSRNGGSWINPCCSVLLLSCSSFSTQTNRQATVMPQSKTTELCSHKVNLPASCEAQRLLRHKVNLLSCVTTKAAVVPQSKSTELRSSAVVIPQSQSTEMWSSAAAAVILQSKSTEMWSSAAPFHHDVWCFRQWYTHS